MSKWGNTLKENIRKRRVSDSITLYLEKYTYTENMFRARLNAKFEADIELPNGQMLTPRIETITKQFTFECNTWEEAQAITEAAVKKYLDALTNATKAAAEDIRK